MRLKKLKLNTECRFGFKIRTMYRMWQFLETCFSVRKMKTKAVDCYSSHYLTIMSFLKCFFPREVTLEKNLDKFIHSGEICPGLCPFSRLTSL